MAGKRRAIMLAGLAAGAVTLAALPVLRSAGGGEASAASVSAGQYITLDKPVLPIPAPATKMPFAQYREMHANCKPVKQAADDPLVFPGLPGASHLHTFVGNTAPTAFSTPESLAKNGSSSCEDPKDTASYWFPTL